MESSLTKTIVLKCNMSCNLRCKYCYEFNRNGTTYSGRHITSDALCKFIERCARLFPKSRLLWMLHGGEPLINGIDYFYKFAECIQRINSTHDVEFKIALQTNATLLTDEWIQALEKYQDLLSERIVSVSIDGPKEINDEVRIARSGDSAYEMTTETIERIRRSNLVFTTISVVGSHNADRAKEVYDFIRSLNPNLCKFIPCYNYDSDGHPELYGINPIQYAQFMCEIFDLWVKDATCNSNGEWFVIDPIATIISKLTDVPVTWCEYRKEKCDNFVSLYSDGEMWLCDTFNHDTMRDQAFLGNIYQLSDGELTQALLYPCKVCSFADFYNDALSQCSKCDIHQYCSGGCLPNRMDMRARSHRLFTDYCKGKHILINHIREGVRNALSQS